jgi:hypothetical protein
MGGNEEKVGDISWFENNEKFANLELRIGLKSPAPPPLGSGGFHCPNPVNPLPISNKKYFNLYLFYLYGIGKSIKNFPLGHCRKSLPLRLAPGLPPTPSWPYLEALRLKRIPWTLGWWEKLWGLADGGEWRSLVQGNRP